MVVVLFLILWLMATPALAVQSCPSNTVPVGNGVQIDPTCKKAPDAAINDAYSGVGACAANNWVSTLNRDAAPTCTQPNFTSLSGSASCSQLPALTGDTTTAAGSCGTTTLKTNGTAFGALATLGVGTSLQSSGGNLNLNITATTCSGTTPFMASLGASGAGVCDTTAVSPTITNMTMLGATLQFQAPNGGTDQFAFQNAGATTHWIMGEQLGAAGQQGAWNVVDQVAGKFALYIDPANDALQAPNGGVESGAPTGGAKGTGTYNGTAYYINGNVVTGSAVDRTPVAADDIISAIADTGENFASFLATSAITIQSFKIYVELAAGACTTKPTYDLVKGTTYNTVATTIKSACVASSETAVGVTDCGVTSATTGAAVAANTYVWIKVNTAASVCAPKNHVVWEYTMQ